MRAEDSLAIGALPLGLAHGFKVLHPVAQGQPVRWQDVAYDPGLDAVRVRKEMEALFGPRARAAA
jgi:predicted homoserine dehydrogenase-like protein